MVSKGNADMRFRGRYQHTVDAKGRVSLPAKFRKALPESLVILAGFNGELLVFAEEEYDAWADSFFDTEEGKSHDPLNPKDNQLLETLYGDAEDATVDSAGRITISPLLRNAANIKKDVYIVGVLDHIEIWNKETREAYMDGISLASFQADSEER